MDFHIDDVIDGNDVKHSHFLHEYDTGNGFQGSKIFVVNQTDIRNLFQN